MTAIASDPIDQIVGWEGMLKPITWADVLDDDSDDQSGCNVELTSLSEAVEDIKLIDGGAQGEESSLKVTEAEETEPQTTSEELTKSQFTTPPKSSIGAEKKVIGFVDKPSVCSSASASSSSSLSSSSSSSCDELPTSLEPRQRYNIGIGVYSLCETLKQVKVGTIERPSIYFHPKDENGEYLETLIPVNAVGEVPILSSSSSVKYVNNSTNTKFTSPMVNALGRCSFQPRNATHSRCDDQSRWHVPSTYRSAETRTQFQRQQQQQHEHQPNFAPFYSNRRKAEQRAQLQLQNQSQFRMRNDAEQWQGQRRGQVYEQFQHRPYTQWQEQTQYQQPAPYQNHLPVEMLPPSRVPPPSRASLYGLLPTQGYDTPSYHEGTYDMPIQQEQSYERVGVSQRQYDPAPHQSHWRANVHERSETPLTWSPARGANAIPLRGESRYPIPTDSDEYRPAPEIWRRDVDLVKKGILHRTRK